jgi:hypothetical protein
MLQITMHPGQRFRTGDGNDTGFKPGTGPRFGKKPLRIHTQEPLRKFREGAKRDMRSPGITDYPRKYVPPFVPTSR